MKNAFAPASRAFAEGRFDDAAEALARALGRPWRPERTLALRHKPSQDLLYARHWREDDEAASDRRALKLAEAAVARRPGDGALRALRGMLRLYARDLDGALRDLDAALRLDARQPWARAWRYAALTLAARRDSDLPRLLRAAPDLDRALSDDPRNPLALALRAEFLHDRERYAEALRDLRLLRKVSPGHDWALSETGEIHTEMGRLADARRAFDALIARHPREAWAYAMRARSEANGGDARGSLAGFDRAIALSPRWPALFAWRGEARRKAGDWKGAFSDFDRCLKLDPGYLVARAWRGHARLLRGQHAAAVADLDRAVCADCRQMLFYAWRGEALFKLGRFREAASDFDRCHPFHPRLSWTQRPGLKDREASLRADLDDAARGGDPWAEALRGRFLLDGSSPGAWMKDLGAVSARPGPARAWAMAWFGEGLRREGRSGESRRVLEAASALAPGHWLSRAWLARVLLDLKKPRPALGHARAALRLRPDHPFPNAVAGESLWRLGRREEARPHLDAARWLGPNDPETGRSLAAIPHDMMKVMEAQR